MTVFYNNNKKAIKLAKNPIFQKWFKYIIIKYYYIKNFIWIEKIIL